MVSGWTPGSDRTKSVGNGAAKGGNGSTPHKRDDQSKLPPVTQKPADRELTPKEKYLQNKQQNGGVFTSATTKPQDATLALAQELLKAGGFGRRLTWRERRALRAVERACDSVRRAVGDVFDAPPASVSSAIDGLAALEAICRLEAMKAPAKK